MRRTNARHTTGKTGGASLGKRSQGNWKRFALIDARPLPREALACWLRSLRPRSEVIVFRDVEAFLAAASAKAVAFDIILFGSSLTSLPGSALADEIGKLSGISSQTPIVVVSETGNVAEAIGFLRHGVRAFIPTSLEIAVVVGALDFVMAGGTFVPVGLIVGSTPPAAVEGSSMEGASGSGEAAAAPGPSINDMKPECLAHVPQGPKLTRRETQVLACLRRGKPNKQIAYDLAMRENTVKVHVRHLMKKLRATNRTEVALLAESILLNVVNYTPLDRRT
jgi:DNA-binding NarL/FixJ family response regulator